MQSQEFLTWLICLLTLLAKIKSAKIFEFTVICGLTNGPTNIILVLKLLYDNREKSKETVYTI